MRTHTRTTFLVSLMAVSGGILHGATTLQAAPDQHETTAATARVDRVRCWAGRVLEGRVIYLEPSQLIPTRQRHGGSKSRIQTGLLPRARYYEVAQLKQDIRTNSHVPLTHLLNTPQEAFTRLHHSYAWSLIHFLIHDNDGINRKHLVRLLQVITDGESIEATLESIFNVDLDTIEAHWKRYVLKLAM